MPRTNGLRTSLILTASLLFGLFTPGTAAGQFEIALHGDQILKPEMYGLGGTLLVPIKSYSYDIALGGQYYFAGDDSTSATAVDLDIHTNLFVFRFLRPYTGIGLGYFHRGDLDKVGLNLKAGVYVHVWNQVVPYVQYVYRSIPSIDNSYMQAGFRILFRRQ